MKELDGRGMKIGDRVEVIAVPVSLPPGMGTRAGLPVAGIDNGLLKLRVVEETSMHSV